MYIPLYDTTNPFFTTPLFHYQGTNVSLIISLYFALFPKPPAHHWHFQIGYQTFNTMDANTYIIVIDTNIS